MRYLLVKLTRIFGVIFILLIVGTRTLSSSALLFRVQLCLPSPAPNSLFGGRHNGRMKALHDHTETIGTSAESRVERSGQDFSGEQNDDNINSNSILTFRSSFKRQSNPFVHLPSNVKLDDFLLHSDHLLDAGKSVDSKIVPKTTKLFEEWTIACDRVGACPPNIDNGVITAVRIAGISIPGITIEWSALIGINLVYRSQRHHDQHQYPELQSVLIKDKSKVSSGAKPIVWIFNKLTRKRNNGSRGRIKFRPSHTDTKLFTRLGFYKDRSLPVTCGSKGIGNSMNESLFIRSAGTMEMRFRIPSMLGRIFLSSEGDTQKAEAERRISNIITRQIEKDAEQNILRWEENFEAWTHGFNECRKGE